MKKTLLTLFAIVASLCTINAAEVTFDFVNNAYGLPDDGNTYVKSEKAVNGDVTLSFDKTSGNGFRKYTDGLRVYNTNSGNASISISIPNAKVTAISMAVKAVLGTVTIDGSALTYTSSSKTYSWTGDKADPTIVITVSATKAIQTLKITYEADDPSDTRGAADIKFAESTYYANEGEAFTAPVPTKATTAALTYTSSKPEVAAVDANTGAVTIVAPGTTEITATAAENTEFKAGEASYTLEVLKVVNSLAETMAVTDATMKLRINYPLVLAFKNKTNNFVCNGNDFIQIYGTIDYEVGDVIPAGWIGCYTLYKDKVPEITDPANMQPSTENNGFTPAKVSAISEADVNKVVTLENVVFTEATPSTVVNFTGTVGESSYTFRNNYSLASVEAGTYNVTGVVNIYVPKTGDPTVQFYPTAYEKVEGTTGIADIVADENAPVEYFNLQGIRVDNPENGLYIRRQGNKVTKVIVK